MYGLYWSLFLHSNAWKSLCLLKIATGQKVSKYWIKVFIADILDSLHFPASKVQERRIIIFVVRVSKGPPFFFSFFLLFSANRQRKPPIETSWSQTNHSYEDPLLRCPCNGRNACRDIGCLFLKGFAKPENLFGAPCGVYKDIQQKSAKLIRWIFALSTS